MQNPVPKSNFFATMTMKQIQDFIEVLPRGQQAGANMLLMFTLNHCHDLVQKQLDKQAV